ncbi:RagB/SusD family nutrient uptake outer membrane protein [Carboxylicivirga taeanensis]|uniref:RagB/SusD family nutrient uptake outer membrane protein n=1 Tax=Carboxylicivirga taeanensis TaxID=1416875 RepID=UPI003F6DD824
MKYINKYIALLLGVLMLTSCEDWLHIVQEGTIPTEEIDYSDPSQMYSPVSGVYANARRKLSQWETWPLLNVRNDDVTKGGGSVADQGGYLDFENFNYDAVKGFWALNNSWNAYYQIVIGTYNNTELLNRFREHLTTDEQFLLADQYEAEIVFHRALAYYMISNLWGDVPLIDAEDVNFAFPYRSSQAKVREAIHEELDFCITHLPETQPAHKGAVTKYTAMTLKAKVALLEGNYELVKTLTDEIIEKGGYGLYDDYYNLFKIPGKLCSESIYELQFTDFGNGSGDQVYGGAWFQHQGPRNNPAPISGWGFMLLEPEFLQFMKDRGETKRWNVAVLESDAVTPAGDNVNLFQPDYMDIKAHYNGKAYVPKSQITDGRNDYGSNNNIRVLRYADVLLMNAEAKVRVGGDAATPFNEVRLRAGLAPISNPTIEDILDERRAELSVEWGERFNDLVRTGKAAEVLPGFVAGKHEFLPIPTSQEDLNPNLLEPVQD